MPIRPGQAKGAYTGQDGGGGGGGSVNSVSANAPLASTGGTDPFISLGGLTSFGSPGQIMAVAPDGSSLEWKDESVAPQVIVQALYPAWSSGTSYPINSFVSRNGIVYMSKVDGNTGNDPETSAAEWYKFGTASDNTHAAAMKFLGDMLNPWG